jgi:hypothetical protein
MKDLFQHINELPLKIQEILNKYREADFSYELCGQMEAELNPLGYSFEWGLTGGPFNLKKETMNKEISLKELGSIFESATAWLIDGALYFAEINKDRGEIIYSVNGERETLDLITEIKEINDPTWGKSYEVFCHGINDSFILTPLFSETI